MRAALVLAATLVPPAVAGAQTTIDSYLGPNSGGGVGAPGQQLTLPGSGTFDHLGFNFYADLDATVPSAFGRLYVLGSEYLGAPDALSPATPGFLGRSQAVVDGGYVFDPAFALTGGQTYYVYTDAIGPVVGFAGLTSPVGYATLDPATPFQREPGAAFDFRLTSEPSGQRTLESFIGGFGGYTYVPGVRSVLSGHRRYDHLGFNFFSDPAGTTPSAAGTLYVFGSQYEGTPAGLGSAPGLLARSQAVVDGRYVFDPTFALTAGATYWFYADAPVPIAYTTDVTVPGEGIFGAPDVASPFVFPTGGELAFRLTGQAVTTTSEPSTLALVVGGVLAVGAARRRRTGPGR